MRGLPYQGRNEVSDAQILAWAIEANLADKEWLRIPNFGKECLRVLRTFQAGEKFVPKKRKKNPTQRKPTEPKKPPMTYEEYMLWAKENGIEGYV
jgi:hypothetical protein